MKQYQVEKRIEKAKKVLQDSNNDVEVEDANRGEKIKLAGATNKWPVCLDDQLTRDMAIMKWLASDNLPYNLVNTPAFAQRRVAVVDQAYNMKAALSLSLQVESLKEGSILCVYHKLNASLCNTI